MQLWLILLSQDVRGPVPQLRQLLRDGTADVTALTLAHAVGEARYWLLYAQLALLVGSGMLVSNSLNSLGDPGELRCAAAAGRGFTRASAARSTCASTSRALYAQNSARVHCSSCHRQWWSLKARIRRAASTGMRRAG